MITPVYFPFTDIPDTISGALLSCFEKIVVYHPDGRLVPESLRALSAQDQLDLRFPDVREPDPLPALLKEYHSWAELHRGDTPDFHKFGASPPPFSDEASTAWIRSEIRKMKTVSPEDKEDDRLLNARLFLAISQEYDRQEASLLHDLHRISAREKALFQELSPDLETFSPIVPGHPSGRPEAGRPMPEERLSAWGRLYAHCTRDTSAAGTSSLPLFVTSDGEIFSSLLARVNSPPHVCTVSAIPCREGHCPVRNPGVSEQIEAILKESVLEEEISIPREISYSGTGNCHEKTASLSIFRINQAPVDIFLPGTDTTSDHRNSFDSGYNAPSFFMGYVTPG